MRAGSVRAGSARAGSVRAGSVRAGSVRAGSVRAGSVRAGSVRAPVVRQFGARGSEDALSDVYQAVGSVSYLLKPLQDLLDTVLETVGGVLIAFGAVGAAWVRMGRHWRLRARWAWRQRRPGRERWPVRARRAVVPVVVAGGTAEIAG